MHFRNNCIWILYTETSISIDFTENPVLCLALAIFNSNKVNISNSRLKKKKINLMIKYWISFNLKLIYQILELNLYLAHWNSGKTHWLWPENKTSVGDRISLLYTYSIFSLKIRFHLYKQKNRLKMEMENKAVAPSWCKGNQVFNCHNTNWRLFTYKLKKI